MRAHAPYDRLVRKACAVFLVLSLAGSVAIAVAQPPASSASPHPLSEYGGVTPGQPNPPPRVAVLRAHERGGAHPRARANEIIAWPGFQMQPSGASRFFVETTGAVATEVHPSAGRVEVLFHDTSVHLANSRRWLETQFFDTPVLRARLERRGHDMVLVLELRAAVTPSLSTSAGPTGFTFTYVDFGAGHYLPATPPSVAPPPMHTDSHGGSASVRPTTPDSETAYPTRDDPERPPPVQVH